MSVIVIGAGQAAASLAAKFCSLDTATKLTIIGEEPLPPYQRPPLSKKYLSGEMEAERLLLRPKDWYAQNDIDLKTGIAVTAIDRTGRNVTLADGSMLDYDKLVFATGARPRLLPDKIGGNAKGVYTVRNLADVDAMRGEFKPGRNLVIIGGGYIGLEAAAIARKFDVKVTLIEAAPRILGRVASEKTADFIRDLHRSRSADIRESIALEKLETSDGRVSGVVLGDGSTLKADFVIVGIGIIPNTELAEAAGIKCDQGILVDQYCRTSNPDIYAAGDCTRFDYHGELIRIESVGNAIDQGEIVAQNLAGQQIAYQPKPWFWSDQYEMSLQIAGLNLGYDDTVLRPGTREGTQSVWYYKGAQLIAVDAMGDPRAYMVGKKLIEAGKNLPKQIAADADADLKQWM